MGHRGHGEGTITKRKDGRYTAALSIGDGKRKWFYGKTRREVTDLLVEARTLQRQGRLITAPSQTVEQFLTRWLEDVARIHVSPTTYVAYRIRLNRLLPHLGAHKLHTLKPAHIQNSYATLLETLSPRSVHVTHSTLRQALQQAVEWDLLARNPADSASVPHVQQHEMKVLTSVQVQQLLASTQDDEWHALWVLLATTGMRIGEVLGLQWSDVADTSLVIRRTLHFERNKGLVFVQPKTRASRRTLHLTSQAVRALKAHRLAQLEKRLKAGSEWKDGDLVFCMEDGRPVHSRRVNDWFDAALTKADLPHIRVHDLRHTVATLLLTQGVSPRVVQEMLGHSSIVITLGTYSHVLPTMHKDAVTRIQELLEGTGS